MSKYKKYLKYQQRPSRRLLVAPEEHFTLQVLAEAEEAGKKAGRKAAKKALKRAQLSAELNESEVEQLSATAERAGAAGALASARKTLDKRLQSALPEQEPEAASGAEAPGTVRDEESKLQGLGQHVLTIRRTEQLSPEMLRIVAGAPGLAGFRPNAKADQYVKVYFADPQLGLTPPYDLKALRQRLPREQLPRSRSYTIRWVDEDAEELAIDFVLHQDPGSAGDWAAAVGSGDLLVISAARGKFTPSPRSDYYIFAADEAGIPAVSAAMDMLPASAQGVALLEVSGQGSEFDVPHPEGVELRWLHRNGAPAGTTDLLAGELGGLPHPPRSTAVMAHAERTAAKAMARIASGWGLDKKQVHVSSYWTLRQAKS